MTTPLPQIGKVAKNALETIDIYYLENLTKISEHSLSQLHGVGPKAISILRETLADNKMSFGEKSDISYPAKFAVLGDLSCDNAPKRRYIRDFFIALLMASPKYINQNVEENLQGEVVAEGSFSSSQDLITYIKSKNWKISSLNLESILSHGKEGAATATITLTNGQQIKLAGFFKFFSHKKDALISSCQLFIIEEK